MIAVRDTREGARFAVRVTPRASKTAVTGTIGEGAETAVKIALHTPPVEGKANAALVEFLAELLGVRRSAIEITAGEHARNKVILVRGVKAAVVAAGIEAKLA
ncbi:MAG TPA: DUF167 domain-containing protein [Acidobacteriaceae bacterium]|jgi:uncharacterized protein (TIGR00251 family)|nr:DUF167 domain-containing protein [Acidobacteriaceae bacterium]